MDQANRIHQERHTHDDEDGFKLRDRLSSENGGACGQARELAARRCG